MVVRILCGIVLALTASFTGGARSQATQSPGPDSAAPNGVVLTNLEPPVYPPMARTARVSGEVDLTVLIRPDGSVDSVKVDSGPPMLHQAAVDSASHSQFECRGCDARVTTYKLVYLFTFVERGDCCNSFGMPATVEQKVEPSQVRVTIAAPVSCLCDPAATISRTLVRSAKCLWLWRCSARTE